MSSRCTSPDPYEGRVTNELDLMRAKGMRALTAIHHNERNGIPCVDYTFDGSAPAICDPPGYYHDDAHRQHLAKVCDNFRGLFWTRVERALEGEGKFPYHGPWLDMRTCIAQACEGGGGWRLDSLISATHACKDGDVSRRSDIYFFHSGEAKLYLHIVERDYNAAIRMWNEEFKLEDNGVVYCKIYDERSDDESGDDDDERSDDESGGGDDPQAPNAKKRRTGDVRV